MGNRCEAIIVKSHGRRLHGQIDVSNARREVPGYGSIGGGNVGWRAVTGLKVANCRSKSLAMEPVALSRGGLCIRTRQNFPDIPRQGIAGIA
jgi:hypothetical protein